MANYAQLKSAIQQVIKTNGNNEITGSILQQSLLSLINSLGAGYQYVGVATPQTDPGTPDNNVFYFAGPGTYPNFNNITIQPGYLGLLAYNGSWSVATVQTSTIISNAIQNGIVQLMDGTNPIYPRTKAEAVFLWDDTEKTLDIVLGQINEIVTGTFLYKKVSPPVGGYRLSQSQYLGHPGETVKITMEVVDGSDSGKWRIYGTNADGTAIDTSTILIDDANFGETKQLTIPSNGYIWLFTVLQFQDSRSYGITVQSNESLVNDVEELNLAIVGLENNIDELDNEIFPDNFTVSKSSGRVSQLLTIGHAGKTVKTTFVVKTGTDTGNWQIFGTNNGAIDVNNPLIPESSFGSEQEFTVPADGKIWLFTFDTSIATARTYQLTILDKDTLRDSVNYLLGQIRKPLDGKTIVCFGDSITEFVGNDNKRYSDWIAEITGATVINVGVGGTQLRQRLVPISTPTTVEECYAGLDIVNMVKSAMTNNFTIATACAQKLSELTADDNRAIVTRLSQIDWSKVDYVTILGGTNDWYNNNGNTGDAQTTDIAYTCGAINDIISRICSTYKNIAVYWFTPIIRCVTPNFSASKQYYIGDKVEYQSNYYEFINDHIGAWNASDVTSIPKTDFLTDTYFSDNYVFNGKNLREFSALIQSVAIKNHIPVCDLYNGLGWNLYNFLNYFYDTDFTHPHKGFKALAEKMSKFICYS